jgi:hypothetical protein
MSVKPFSGNTARLLPVKAVFLPVQPFSDEADRFLSGKHVSSRDNGFTGRTAVFRPIIWLFCRENDFPKTRFVI